MNIKASWIVILVLTSLIGPGNSFAGIPIVSVSPTITTTGQTDTKNRGYVGLKWTLGKGVTPAVVIGFRHARVEDNGDTEGGDISFSFNLAEGVKAGTIKTKYFNGQENLQGEFGAGYDFSQGMFVSVGANGPFTNLGIDYLFNSASPWQPFFMLHSIDGYDKPSKTTTTSCPSGFTYNAVTGLCESGGGGGA